MALPYAILAASSLIPATQDQKATLCVAGLVLNLNEVIKDENERCYLLRRRRWRLGRVTEREQVSVSRRGSRQIHAASTSANSRQSTVLRTARGGDGLGYSRSLPERGNSCLSLQPCSFAEDVERHPRQDAQRRELLSSRRSLRLDIGDLGTDRAADCVAGGQNREVAQWPQRRRNRSHYAKDFGEADRPGSVNRGSLLAASHSRTRSTYVRSSSFPKDGEAGVSHYLRRHLSSAEHPLSLLLRSQIGDR